MKYSTIIYEKKGRIAKITLNRPEVLNAMNKLMGEEITQAVDDIENDEEIDVLILTGAGPKAFTAGMDLKEPGGVLQPNEKLPATKRLSYYERVRNLPIPTICAVNGYAITGGLELAMCCDIIIASENAMFADTHARVGVHPGAGMTQMLCRLVGPTKAKELSFTGNYLSAQEALQFGLVTRVVPPDELQSVSEGIARDIISCNQKIVRRLKNLINVGMGATIETGLALEKQGSLTWRESLKREAGEAARTREAVLERGRAQSKKET